MKPEDVYEVTFGIALAGLRKAAALGRPLMPFTQPRDRLRAESIFSRDVYPPPSRSRRLQDGEVSGVECIANLDPSFGPTQDLLCLRSLDLEIREGPETEVAAIREVADVEHEAFSPVRLQVLRLDGSISQAAPDLIQNPPVAVGDSDPHAFRPVGPYIAFPVSETGEVRREGFFRERRYIHTAIISESAIAVPCAEWIFSLILQAAEAPNA